MPYYVEKDGSLFTFTVNGHHTIKLSNGVILDDPPPGKMFATRESAKMYSDLVKLYGLDVGKKKHMEWIHRLGHIYS